MAYEDDWVFPEAVTERIRKALSDAYLHTEPVGAIFFDLIGHVVTEIEHEVTVQTEVGYQQGLDDGAKWSRGEDG